VKILHISEVSAGGVLKLVHDFAAHQSSAGHDVATAGGPALRLDGARHFPWQGSRRRVPLAAYDTSRLRRVVQDFDPEVVHLHSFFAGVFGRIPFAIDRPLVYQPHSWAFDAVRTQGARKIVRAVERSLAHRTDMLVTNCQDEIDEALRQGLVIRRSMPVGVGVDLSHFRPPTQVERQQAKHRLGIASRRRVVLLSGRLSWQKGQDLLVPAWAADPPPGAVLALLGSGDATSLQRAAGDEWGRSILQVGHSDHVRDWYFASDVMVVPSRYEGQAVAISEALATGLPVAAWAVNGARAAITDPPLARAGAVVEVGDVPALLKEVRLRLSDDHLREADAAAARQRALNLSDPKDVLRRLDTAYQEAM